MRGEFFETDYASFRSWLDWGCPAAGAYDCFAAACVVSADGAVIFGEMAAHTSNAGQVYFPCGTPDRDDVIGGKVDLLHSCTRELKEETGFDAADFSAEPGWRIVELPSRIVAVKLLRSRHDAETLRAQALGSFAQRNPAGTRRYPRTAGPPGYRCRCSGFCRGVPALVVAVTAC